MTSAGARSGRTDPCVLRSTWVGEAAMNGVKGVPLCSRKWPIDQSLSAREAHPPEFQYALF
jgi:hypothetical protein